jgi:hypothetical protein
MMTATQSDKRVHLRTVRGTFAVTKLSAGMPVPAWASLGALSSVTRTGSELSIVCLEENVPLDMKSERGFRCLAVAETLDFTLVGILASLLDPLAGAGIAVFVISTFDTDFVLVRACDFEASVQALQRAGHRVSLGED